MAANLPPLIGESEALLEVVEDVSRLAALSKPALIIGERGTGKELLAARLHYLSPRWDGPFIKLNCAAVSETLLESELFGHVAGAYTGATKGRVGRFELADGGSLFLDELTSMSLRLQEKLLRLIEYGEFERVGSSETLRVSVRLIGAANADLPALVETGEFRGDLLDRLAFDVVTLPPLRARPEDIPLLAQFFGENMAKELRHEFFPGFAPRAISQMQEYPWPGNVRELRNVIERAVYRHDGSPDPIPALQFDPFASPWRPPAKPGGLRGEAAPAVRPAAAAPAYPFDFKAHVEAMEIELLQKALDDHRYNQRQAADALQMSYDQLRGYVRKYELNRPS